MPMIRLLHWFESGINAVLIILMAIVVLLTTVDLGWIIFSAIMTAPAFRLEVSQGSGPVRLIHGVADESEQKWGEFRRPNPVPRLTRSGRRTWDTSAERRRPGWC